MKEYPKEFKETHYAYAFFDFDASTGFHLKSRLVKKGFKKNNSSSEFYLL